MHHPLRWSRTASASRPAARSTTCGRVKADMYPQGAIDVGAVARIAQGPAFKRLEQVPTADGLKGMLAMVWTPGM